MVIKEAARVIWQCCLLSGAIMSVKLFLYFFTTTSFFFFFSLRQRFAQWTAEPTASAWAGPVAVRKAGREPAATSVFATPSASSTEPARTGSASVTRAGTESTAPSVSATAVHVRWRVCLYPCGHVSTGNKCFSFRSAG